MADVNFIEMLHVSDQNPAYTNTAVPVIYSAEAGGKIS